MTAVIIDTVSIQEYIFSSNKLRENIGASYIIEYKLYKELIPFALNNIGFPGINHDAWNDATNNEAVIGYIGGGNALVLFQQRNKAEAFIQQHSLLILKSYPGVQVAYALQEDFQLEAGFQHSMKEINKKLAINKSLHAVVSSPFKHGITSDCPYSNEGQEKYFTFFDTKGEWISMRSFIKWNIAEAANKLAIKQFITNDAYTFTTDIQKLGQPADKSYIAVVHIDGNGMGKKFMECKKLEDLRRLSWQVSELATNTMKELAGELIGLYENGALSQNEEFELEKDDNNKKILPLRPIITGGDDITFVCDGRLGVYLAERFIQLFQEKSLELLGEHLSACAGVAIVGTKYPFYRAYSLGEELIDEAKNASRPKPGSSWLSFLISTGGFSGNLAATRKQQQTTPKGNSLTLNPYRIDISSGSIQSLKKGIQHLTNNWPRSKMKELRDALRRNEHAQEFYITEMEHRGRTLLAEEIFKDSFFTKDNKTPFYDMVTLADFYPKELLTNKKDSYEPTRN